MRRTTDASDVSDIGKKCAFCGAALEPMTIPRPPFVPGEPDEAMTVGYRQCGCEKSKKAQRAREAQEDERKRKGRLAAIKKAGVKPRYWRAEHPRAADVVEACKKRRNVYVCGPVGSLKTTLVSAAVVAMVDDRAVREVRMATTVEVLDAIRRTFGSHEQSDPLKPYKRASVLVLDDIGKESPTDWVLEKLFDLVNERHSNLLPTVITTQFEPDALISQLAKKGGEENAVAIVSRLRDKAGGTLMIRMEGSDRRNASNGI